LVSDPEAACFNYIMGWINLILAGLDFGVAAGEGTTLLRGLKSAERWVNIPGSEVLSRLQPEDIKAFDRAIQLRKNGQTEEAHDLLKQLKTSLGDDVFNRANSLFEQADDLAGAGDFEAITPETPSSTGTLNVEPLIKRSTHWNEPEIESGVVAKETTSEGHTIKVLRDGYVVICSKCDQIRNRYPGEIARRVDLRRELNAAEGIKKPKEKAAKVKEIEEKLRLERMVGPDEPIPGVLLQLLRNSSPSKEVRDKIINQWIAEQGGRQIDPVYGIEVDKLVADHIVPFNTIIKMEGFNRLSWDNQMKVLNYEENFIAVGLRINAARRNTSWAEWRGHPDFGSVPEAFKSKMIQRETELIPVLQQLIQTLLATQ
jgi:hypothetical protein